VEGAGGGTDLAGDLELVVSELATNVIEHTGSPTLTVVLARTIADWLVEVSDVADLGILDDVALPYVSQPAGRGLFVVRSIVDEMSIVEAGDAYAIRCRIAVA
jgi:anti-sigma regulatory factor (Ser/Thr protein kinase)